VNDRVPVSALDLGAYFLRLSAFGFVGPVALAHAIRRELVKGAAG
jgi:hypothetical protein